MSAVGAAATTMSKVVAVLLATQKRAPGSPIGVTITLLGVETKPWLTVTEVCQQ